MARTKVDDDRLLDRLMHVFRVHGYEGASLSRLSEATGLRRASLYTRFPGGKDEMAQAVLERAGARIAERIIGPLTGSGSSRERLQRAVLEIRSFYDEGREPCLVDAFSFGGDASGPLQSAIRQAAATWLDAFSQVARDAGLDPTSAQIWAEDALIRIQGSLVLARALDQSAPFLRALDALPASLVEATQP